MDKELPIKVELIVFAHVENTLRFLLLKRSPEEGGFWQPVTGTLEMNESLRQCMRRELKEETGIKKITHISDEVYRFSWNKGDEIIVEMVYGVKVHYQSITISAEHTDYQWCDFDTALRFLEKENNKEAFLRFHKRHPRQHRRRI